QALAALTRERTSITITHDAHSARSCDRIIWLEHGHITEAGRREDLLRDPGSRFARWMEEQGLGVPPGRAALGRPGVPAAAGTLGSLGVAGAVGASEDVKVEVP
ncbi:ABC transporter ATP-binding protein, partial [Arthrobacter sp. NPDC056493]